MKDVCREFSKPYVCKFKNCRQNIFRRSFRMFLYQNPSQTPPPHPLRKGPILIKGVQWAETNEKSSFRFFVFELWSILYWKFFENLTILSTKSTISQKLKIGKGFFLRFNTFRIFHVNMTTFEQIRGFFLANWQIRKKNWWRPSLPTPPAEVRPPGSGCFWINSP